MMKPSVLDDGLIIELEPKFSQRFINHSGRSVTNIRNLKHYISSFGPIPKNTSYLGTCEDGLPLFVDLSDSSPGSLLLIGNEQNDCISFLRNLLASTFTLNQANSLHCSVITPNQGNFSDLIDFGPMNSQFSTFESAAHRHIVELSILAEQRRSGRHNGPVHLIILDDVTELLKYQDFETSNHLSWLISNGPKNSICLVASIQQNMLDKIDKSILSCFKTYILSNMDIHLSDDNYANNATYVTGYSTQIGDETIRFHLPMLV